MRRGWLVAVALVCLVAPAAQAERRVSTTHTFTTTVPGKPAGRLYTLRVVDPANPAAKPPALARMALVLPSGSRFDPGALPACTATDAVLLIVGAAACPPASRLGSDLLVTDTGAGLFTTEFTLFNAPGQVLLVGAPRGLAGQLVLRATVAGRRFTLDLPLLPGTPPDLGANRSEHAQFVRAGRYFRTPAKCPRSRQWVTRITYTFRDGVTENARAESPCVRRRAR